MTSSDEKSRVRELLPLYARSRASEAERRLVEEACATNPELAAELSDWCRLEAAYASLERELPSPPPFLYTRIRERVQENRQGGFLARMLGNRRLVLGIMAAELAAVFLLATALLTRHEPYRTLSAGGSASSAAAAVKLNVVFRTGVRQEEVAGLLKTVGGRIVDGPLGGGLFIVSLQPGAAPEAALSMLRASGMTFVAEKAY